MMTRSRSRGAHGAWPGAATFAALLFIHVGWLSAQTPEDTSAGVSKEPRRSGLVFIPVLYYTPETKTAAGAAVQFYFRRGDDPDARPSTLLPILVYTQKNQIFAALAAELYSRDETYRMIGFAGFSKFPDLYYGIGNDTPESAEEDWEPQYVDLKLGALRRIHGGLYAGLGYEYQHTRIRETEDDGLIDTGSLRGRDGGITSAAVALINWDTRDNTFFPASGSYHQLTAALNDGALGSDFDYQRYVVDLRRYVALGQRQVLAIQGIALLTDGAPPFYALPRFGGQNVMRGYYEGRFRDRNLVAMQAEYRVLPVLGRFGLVGFAGLGDINEELNDFRLNELKYSLGGGVRFLLSPEEKITLRLDFGVGEDTSGFYITLGEAF